MTASARYADAGEQKRQRDRFEPNLRTAVAIGVGLDAERVRRRGDSIRRSASLSVSGRKSTRSFDVHPRRVTGLELSPSLLFRLHDMAREMRMPPSKKWSFEDACAGQRRRPGGYSSTSQDPPSTGRHHQNYRLCHLWLGPRSLGGYQPTMESGDILGHENMSEVIEFGSEVRN